MLLGDEVVFGLCALEEAFARKAARADGNLGLVDVVAHILGVVEHAQHDEDTVALVGLQHMVEGVVDGEHEHESDGKYAQHLDDASLFGNDVIGQREDEQAAKDDIHHLL